MSYELSAIRGLAFEKAGHQSHDEKYEKDEEEGFAYGGQARRNPGEPQQRRTQRNDEKCDCPVKHVVPCA